MRYTKYSFLAFVYLLCVFNLVFAQDESHKKPGFSETVVSPNRSYTLLVVTRKHCPHCEKWENEVEHHWSDLGLDKVLPLSQVKILDAAKEADLVLLVEMLSKKKIKYEVNAVPSFILLDDKGSECRDSRILGFVSPGHFKKELIEFLSFSK